MQGKEEMTARGIRIADSDWEKLVREAHPENVSILIRKIIRDFLEVKKQN